MSHKDDFPILIDRPGLMPSLFGSTSLTATRRATLFGLGGAISLGFVPAAHALPTGGSVSVGAATIANGPSSVTINQSSQNAAISWQNFGVNTGEAVTFKQPSSSSITLNRVVGTAPSAILGKLSANGRVFVVNPNGILFGKSAQVNVGGLVASTQGITDANFAAGAYKFAGTSSNAVLNQGAITASNGGYVALLGAHVTNTGVIVAKMGSVTLAGGDAMTLDGAG
jgi:filamentous hemagglutinin family protein